MGFFYSCQFIKSFRPFHSFWVEEELFREINTSFNTSLILPLSYHDYSVLGSSSQHCSGIPLKLLCLFSSIFVHYKKLSRGSRLLRNQYRTQYDFQPQNTCQNFHVAWFVILCSIGYTLMCQTKESNKRTPRRAVIYISVHLVLIYTLAFSNVIFWD